MLKELCFYIVTFEVTNYYCYIDKPTSNVQNILDVYCVGNDIDIKMVNRK